MAFSEQQEEAKCPRGDDDDDSICRLHVVMSVNRGKPSEAILLSHAVFSNLDKLPRNLDGTNEEQRTMSCTWSGLGMTAQSTHSRELCDDSFLN
ncbi:hypothetical protein E4U54_008715 [Claviceps lovelessii]|nr:hypothetical protein E4U54_008715 [Claviceps lovelessii]